jgi:RNA polymerase sigma-70 factor (ECF subfamily)
VTTLSNRTAEIQHDRLSFQRHVSPRGSAVLDRGIQAHLGQQLQAWYGNPAEDKLPTSLKRLLNRVAQVIRARSEPVDQAFTEGVLASVPSLRTFAISLTRATDRAEDLVQETVLRAISKQQQFEPGTSLQGWLFTILRNQFLSDHRKAVREVEDVDGSYAATMISIPDQEDRIMIQDLEAALGKLPQGQREAIMLVGADGLSYEEAAQALGCAVGTVKSRVNRARNCLAELMKFVSEDDTAGSRLEET